MKPDYKILSNEEIAEGIKPLAGWEFMAMKDDGDTYSGLTRRYVFKDFNAAMGFMQKCMDSINTLNHHPKWTNENNEVFVELYTNYTGTVTNLDVMMATSMELINTLLVG